mgnify:FL=1
MPLDSTKRFCMACGERKRLTWPKYDPACCTMTCAAGSFVSYAAAGADWEAAHCTNCGMPGDSHPYSDQPCDNEIDKGGE